MDTDEQGFSAQPPSKQIELALRIAIDLLSGMDDTSWTIEFGKHVDDAIDRLEDALALWSSPSEISITPSELAQRWKVHSKTIRRLIEDGRLQAFDAAHGTVPRWRIPLAAAMDYAAEHRKTSVPRGTLGQ